MKNIFEEIDGIHLEEDERSSFGRFCDAFLGKIRLLSKDYFPSLMPHPQTKNFSPT